MIDCALVNPESAKGSSEQSSVIVGTINTMPVRLVWPPEAATACWAAATSYSRPNKLSR
jgi:hypothetical protein